MNNKAKAQRFLAATGIGYPNTTWIDLADLLDKNDEEQKQRCANEIPFTPLPLGYYEVRDAILNTPGEE